MSELRMIDSRYHVHVRRVSCLQSSRRHEAGSCRSMLGAIAQNVSELLLRGHD